MTVRSLYVGLTGLNAMGRGIDVISNNIANTNTVGFRTGRASFDDIFYETMSAGTGATGTRGGINPQQLGTGVKTGSVETIFTQGSTQTTGRLLDMAINGEGFFVLRNGAGEAGQEFLTRAGNFSLDNQGYIVDPGTGYRLIGQVSGKDDAMKIDFNQTSKPKQTQNVNAAGNFDSRIGDPNSGVSTSPAQLSTNLLGMFDEGGVPFGLINGDVLRFDTGFMGIGDPPKNIQSPIDLSQKNIGKGAGVIMTVTATTTVQDLQQALNNFFQTTMSDIRPGSTPDIEVKFDTTSGNYEFANFGNNALSGVRLGVEPRGSSSTPPEAAIRHIGSLFVNQDDTDYTKTLNVPVDSVVKTEKIRRADTATSIDIYDSVGNSHPLTVGLAVDTQQPAGTQTSLVKDLRDSQGRLLIPGGVVPPKPVFSDPVLDSATNTAVFTASQVSNLLITQGVYSFKDGNGNLIALRLSDGALSFNGEGFNAPILANGTINAEITGAGLDVTGDSILNIPSGSNTGGGLLGDDGFTATTTLEQIRQNVENRINDAIRQVSANIGKIDNTTSNLTGGRSNIAFKTPTDIPAITVQLTKDGSLTFSSKNGSLGAADTTDPTLATNLNIAAGGDSSNDKLGMVVDLAAKTRSIRVSTLDTSGTTPVADGKVDNDYTDGGGVTGFIESGDPFAADITKAFSIGNTDTGDATTKTLIAGNPRSDLPSTLPTGVEDSGVQLVAMSSGQYDKTTTLDTVNFSNLQAFKPEVTTIRALFNQRDYGIASNFDGKGGVDRPTGVPVGVVARSAEKAFEINTIHQVGLTHGTVNYQTVVPSDFGTIPTQTTGTLIFKSDGSFNDYNNGSKDSPLVTFDPGGGVDKISFTLDLGGITDYAGSSTAQLQSQDGRGEGNLTNVSIGSSGDILGIFTNGDAQSLGKIRLGTVQNEGGLLQQGSTLFTTGPNSGTIILVDAGDKGGSISSGSLELSNVDMAQEFTNLIMAQRAYQANSRVITTGDQILQELVNLKR